MQVIEAVATYHWRPLLAFQTGVSRRFFSPDFVAQDVGFVRVGVLSETRLTRLATIKAAVAYLPFARFSGGGDARFAAELGLGIAVGRQAGRLAALLEYGYQRIDRRVASDLVPIAWSALRAGLGARF
jgi:hypothetical protein